MPKPNLPLIELLYSALNSEFGVRVRSSNPDLLRQKLYPVMKEDPEFARLSLVGDRLSPTTHLLIVRKPDAEDQTAQSDNEPSGG